MALAKNIPVFDHASVNENGGTINDGLVKCGVERFWELPLDIWRLSRENGYNAQVCYAFKSYSYLMWRLVHFNKQLSLASNAQGGGLARIFDLKAKGRGLAETKSLNLNFIASDIRTQLLTHRFTGYNIGLMHGFGGVAGVRHSFAGKNDLPQQKASTNAGYQQPNTSEQKQPEGPGRHRLLSRQIAVIALGIIFGLGIVGYSVRKLGQSSPVSKRTLVYIYLILGGGTLALFSGIIGAILSL